MNATPLPIPIDLVIGTRPNIVKAGPLLAALRAESWCRPRVVFLAQHTLDAMSDFTLEDLLFESEDIHRIPLSAGSTGSRLGEMIERYMDLLAAAPARLVLVFGDVDATLAAAYAGKRMAIPVAHVEAGLRSGDMRMPEELNRRMIDSIADFLFTTTEQAGLNLLAEGRRPAQITFTGNLMIDAMKMTLSRASVLDEGSSLCAQYGLVPDEYAIATFHRPSNVDAASGVRGVAEVLTAASHQIPVLFPIHPRTQAAFERHGLLQLLHGNPNLKLVPPLRYRHFMALLSRCRLALTDSGGLQEETSVLGIPCLTFRENTERPETITDGTNRLVRAQDAGLEVAGVLASPLPARATIPGWDGRSAARIVQAIHSSLMACETGSSHVVASMLQ